MPNLILFKLKTTQLLKGVDLTYLEEMHKPP